jgi:S-methylmethionine-dependent homocysteine/selenocysteine methylase
MLCLYYVCTNIIIELCLGSKNYKFPEIVAEMYYSRTQELFSLTRVSATENVRFLKIIQFFTLPAVRELGVLRSALELC